MISRQITILSFGILLSMQASTADAQSYRRNDIAARNIDFGIRLSKAGKYRESLVQFDEAIKANPAVADYYIWRGRSLLEVEETRQGMNDLNKAIALDPKKSEAFYLRARAHYELGNYQFSLRDYSTAFNLVKTPIEKAEILRLRARMHAALKKYELSIADLSLSLQFNRDPVAFTLRANQYANVGKYNEAVKDYTDAIAKSTVDDKGKLYSQRAIIYEKIGRKDLAFKDREKAKQLTKDNWGDLLPEMDK